MSQTIVLLGTYSDPALSYQIEAMVAAGFGPRLHVFLDPKEPGDKEIGIWEERTEGRLPGLSLERFPQIPFHFLESHNSAASARLIRELDAVLAVNCGTPRILKDDMLTAATLGVLNIHPGDLPAYRGCTCVEWAIYNDDPVYLTAHIMRDEIDYGPLICRQRVAVKPGDEYADVRVNVFRTAYDLLPVAVRAILDRRAIIADLPMPDAGHYWKVIDQDKLEAVKRKLSDHRYPPSAMTPAPLEMLAPPPPAAVTQTPVLQDGDVRLEPFGEQHLSNDYVGWLGDAHVMRFSEQRHRSHDIQSCRAYWQAMEQDGHPFWAILLRQDGEWRHVGNITASLDRPNNVADVGILVGARTAQGRGVGRRAWRLVCDWLLQSGIRKVSAGTMSVNEPMLRIMRGAGMIEEGRRGGHFLADGAPADLVMFALFAD